MELTDSFGVALPMDEAWELLNNVERIAPCVPGAFLQEKVDEEYCGAVKVRFGALSAEYVGTATFTPDEERRRIVIHAKGNGTQGAAEARITATLEEVSAATTQVNVDATIEVGGRVAQIGQRMLPDLSQVLTARFAENLTAVIVGVEPDPFHQPSDIDMPEPGALDLLDAARPSLLRRLGLVGAAVVLVAVGRFLRRSR